MKGKQIFMNKIKALSDIVNKLRYMLTEKQKRKAGLVLCMIVIGSFLETLGVSAILPFINSILKPEELMDKWYSKPFIMILGEDDVNNIIIGIGLTVILVYIVKNLFIYFSTIYQCKYRSFVNKDLSSKLLKSYMSWPYEDFSSLNTAKIIQQLLTQVTT